MPTCRGIFVGGARAMVLGFALAACATRPTPGLQRFAPLQLAPGVADSVRTELVAPSARLITLINTSAPWRAYVLEVDMTCGSVRALKGSSTAVGRTQTSALLAGLPQSSRAFAAINADFFEFTPPGVPTNLHIEDGVLLAGPGTRPVVAFDGLQQLVFDSVHAEGTVVQGTRTITLGAWNRPVRRTNGVVDARWGVPLDTLVRTRSWRLEPLANRAGAARTIDGRYIVRPAGPADTLIHGDTLLLHLAPREADVSVGDTVQLRVRISGSRSGMAPREAVGGRPMLVVDSVVVNDVETEGNAGFRGLNPRSALGLHPGTKRLWLAVIDGRKPGVTMGTTLRQTADLLRALGATQALNLDGGGSSALVLRDLQTGAIRVVNTPSDPTERAVGNALAVQASCQRL